MEPPPSRPPRRGNAVMLWLALVVVAIGLLATVSRWLIQGFPSSCLTGGGTAAEAVMCGALDVVAQQALLWLIVGLPLLGIVWLVRARGKRGGEP